jgi:hypothetical protein
MLLLLPRRLRITQPLLVEAVRCASVQLYVNVPPPSSHATTSAPASYRMTFCSTLAAALCCTAHGSLFCRMVWELLASSALV